MTAILLLALALWLLIAWGTTLALCWWRTRLPAIRRKVLINYDDDTAIRGVLIEARGDWLVLRQGELLSGETPAALDGVTLVPRARVAFMQVLP